VYQGAKSVKIEVRHAREVEVHDTILVSGAVIAEWSSKLSPLVQEAYADMDITHRLVIKAIIRDVLKKAEKYLGSRARPGRNVDVLSFLIGLTAEMVAELLDTIEVEIGTEDGNAAYVSISSTAEDTCEVWRSLARGGNDRIGQNDIRQDAATEARQSLSSI
jgi:hypothetical protein